jgi:hypothetical protein
MPITNNTITNLLKHIFHNEPIPNIGDTTGLPPSTTTGSLYISLHTNNPTTGNQTTHETNYNSYTRHNIPRTPNHWTITNNTITNNTRIVFPRSTGTTTTLTHFGIGTNETGTGQLLFTNKLYNTVTILTDGIPEFDIGTIRITIT